MRYILLILFIFSIIFLDLLILLIDAVRNYKENFLPQSEPWKELLNLVDKKFSNLTEALFWWRKQTCYIQSKITESIMRTTKIFKRPEHENSGSKMDSFHLQSWNVLFFQIFCQIFTDYTVFDRFFDCHFNTSLNSMIFFCVNELLIIMKRSNCFAKILIASWNFVFEDV